MSSRVRRAAVVAAAALLVPVAFVPIANASGNHGDGDNNRPRAVGYYTQWSNYSGFLVKNVHTSGTARKLTHLNYAFGNVSADGKCFEANLAGENGGDAWADYQRPYGAEESVDGKADVAGQRLNGNFNQLLKLKKKHPRLKNLISLGGWTWSTYFSDAALTAQSRRTFVASCIDLYLKGNLPTLDSAQGGPGSGYGVFDGIDLDWEWPSTPGEPGNVVRPEDKRNFTLLLAEFRRQLDAYGKKTHKHYLLTSFLAANPAQIDVDYEVPKIFKYLDFATLQGYDLHGTWEPTTNHQSALFLPEGDTSDGAFSVDLVVDSYRSRGAPARKLVVGVPFYGQGWTGVPDVNHGLFQEGTLCPVGCGSLNYRDIKALPGFTTYRDRDAGFAWRYDGSTFYTFDDPQVMRVKAKYVLRERLGGVMIWSLDGDTPDGELMSALHDVLR